MNIRLIVALSLVLFAVVVMYVALESVPEPRVVGTPVVQDSGPSQETSGIGQIDDERIKNAESEPGNWLAYGRTYEEQRFSPLDQINRESVSELDLVWYRDMQTTRALEATPIVVDGIMFVSSSWSRVYALNAVSGEEIWSFDPKVPKQWGRRACCDVVNRGVAVYKGQVYVGTIDGRLIALNANDGEVVWEVDTLIDHDRFYTITGAPRVARGKVYIGNGGAEFGVRGYLSAYDAASGDLAWRFYTVPGDPSKPFEHPEVEMAAKTWKGGEWWKVGGGGTVWNSIVYDPEFNHLYFGVGNGSPWPRAVRSPGGGDNLFLSSIVAVDADSGKLQWYYQTTPGENWDYTATQDIMLADMEVDGVQRKVLMQAPKNGFFYVIDRSNGDLLRAHKFVHTTWASHVDLETGRPVENPDLNYIKDAKWVIPTSLGARNWQAMSFDAKKGIVYLTASEISGIYAMDEHWLKTGAYKHQPLGLNLGVELANLANIAAETPGFLPSKGYFKAFNPLTGESDWVIEYPHYWNGGALATAGGLVFQGNAEGKVNAMNSDTGEVMWSFQNYTSIIASPISYQIEGEQYVAIMSGTGGGDLFNGYTSEVASVIYGNHGKLLVFKLGGGVKLPVQEPLDRTIQQQPDLQASAEDIGQGERLFQLNCAACHGFSARAGGVIPDLRYMNEATHQIFEPIVLKGAFLAKGMPKFDDVLDEEGVRLIHAYVVSRAEADRAAQQNATP